MKRFSSNLLNIPIALAVFVFFSACKKEKDDPEKANYIEAKVNGALWTPSSVQCILLEDDTLNFRVVNITATYGGKAITIEADDHGTGASINSGTRSYAAGSAFFRYSTSNVPYNTTSGSINITLNDVAAQQLSGSFSFSAVDNDGNTIQVMDGKFEKVSYSSKVQ